MEACEVCGFEWDAVAPAEVGTRLEAAGAALSALLTAEPARAVERPAPDRWSALEYACHVRDVVVNLRDRIILGLAEDDPVPKPMHGSLRVEELYGLETPDVVAGDVLVVVGMFRRSFARLGDDQWERPIHYGWPRPATRTLRWVAAQALHEAEHHLADAREGLAPRG